MKNNIASLFLILIIIFSALCFTGCREKSAAELFNSAVEKTDNLNSAELKLSMKVTGELDGKLQTVPIDALLKAKNMLSDNPVIYSLIKTEMSGQKKEIESYLEDGWLYVVADGERYKAHADDDDDNEVLQYIDTLDNILEEIPKEILDKAEIKNNTDGSKSITVTPSSEEFCRIYEDLVEGFSYDGEDSSLNMSSISINVTLKSGYIKKYSVDFSVNEEGKGDNEKREISISAEFINPGKKPKITPPEGYESFEHKH